MHAGPESNTEPIGDQGVDPALSGYLKLCLAPRSEKADLIYQPRRGTRIGRINRCTDLVPGNTGTGFYVIESGDHVTIDVPTGHWVEVKNINGMTIGVSVNECSVLVVRNGDEVMVAHVAQSSVHDLRYLITKKKGKGKIEIFVPADNQDKLSQLFKDSPEVEVHWLEGAKYDGNDERIPTPSGHCGIAKRRTWTLYSILVNAQHVIVSRCGYMEETLWQGKYKVQGIGREAHVTRTEVKKVLAA